MNESPFVKDPANPTDAEIAAAIARGLANGTIITAEDFLARVAEGEAELDDNGDGCSECGGTMVNSPESGCCCLRCSGCGGWVMRDQPVHDFSIMLAIPRKFAGAILGYDDYRECRHCGRRAPASAVS